jgi:hypothetical protein
MYITNSTQIKSITDAGCRSQLMNYLTVSLKKNVSQKFLHLSQGLVCSASTCRPRFFPVQKSSVFVFSVSPLSLSASIQLFWFLTVPSVFSMKKVSKQFLEQEFLPADGETEDALIRNATKKLFYRQ